MASKPPVPTKKPERPRAPKFARRYPWRRWFSMKSFHIEKGLDYNGHTYTMAQQIRNAAGNPKWAVKVSITVSEDGNSLNVTVLNKRKVATTNA